GIFSIFVI
nr:Chain v, ermC Nacent chain [Escherichia coli K-12]